MGSLTKTEVINELWRRGRIDYKFHGGQLDFLTFVNKPGPMRRVIRCSRRFGKTYFLMGWIIGRCLQTKTIVRYAAPTKDMLKKILLPIFYEITRDCPRELMPVWRAQDGMFRFHNDSEIHIAGVNGQHENSLRGQAADICIADEAGFIDRLDYLVLDVLQPQLMYTPDPIFVLSSTPPESPAHEFVGYVAEAEANGMHVKKTIWDNPLLTKEKILTYAEECQCVIEGGRIVSQSTTWMREYLAEIVTEQDKAIIPEFDDHKSEQIVIDWEEPEFYRPYTIADFGFIDYTGVVFGYYDFKRGKIVIQDEILANRTNSKDLADMIRAKEEKLWGNKRITRFADGDLILLEDLNHLHNLAFNAVTKDVLEAQVNQLRLDIQHNVVIILPNCKNTVSHLKYAIWDKNRRKFARSDKLGHFDLLAAVIYMVRHIDRTHNPYPEHYGVDLHNSYIKPKESYVAGELNKLFTR